MSSQPMRLGTPIGAVKGICRLSGREYHVGVLRYR
jgi:hypothetical protein